MNFRTVSDYRQQKCKLVLLLCTGSMRAGKRGIAVPGWRTNCWLPSICPGERWQGNLQAQGLRQFLL